MDHARGAWSYVGLRDWAVPFVLPGVGDLHLVHGTSFHYVMRRTRGADRPWAGVSAADVRRHFADTGNPFTKARHSIIRVSEEDLRRMAADVAHFRTDAVRLVSAVRAAVEGRRGR